MKGNLIDLIESGEAVMVGAVLPFQPNAFEIGGEYGHKGLKSGSVSKKTP